MEIQCDNCGKAIKKSPSAVKAENYCDKNCRKQAKRITTVCVACGVSITRLKCQTSPQSCCSLKCAREFTGKQLGELAKKLNPTRMTDEIRLKIRNKHLGKGEGRSYEKIFRRRTHRVVAEQMLGRPLKRGEVVHHINEDIHDNRPENLMVFASQAEHVLWHQQVNYLLYGTYVLHAT